MMQWENASFQVGEGAKFFVVCKIKMDQQLLIAFPVLETFEMVRQNGKIVFQLKANTM